MDIEDRLDSLEEEIRRLKSIRSAGDLQITVRTNTGKSVTAPTAAFVMAMLATLSAKQREAVMTKIAHMSVPPAGKHLLMPNGGYPHDLLNN